LRIPIRAGQNFFPAEKATLRKVWRSDRQAVVNLFITKLERRNLERLAEKNLMVSEDSGFHL